jgi:hypothetical protein
MTITTEVVRQVWLDSEGVAIQVGPDADGLDLVRVYTPNLKAEQYWGKVDITVDPEMARALAHALLAAADEADQSSKSRM